MHSQITNAYPNKMSIFIIINSPSFSFPYQISTENLQLIAKNNYFFFLLILINIGTVRISKLI